MSETYPKKEPLRNAFRRTYTLQRRNRLQRYNNICRYARKIAFWGDFSSVWCKGGEYPNNIRGNGHRYFMNTLLLQGSKDRCIHGVFAEYSGSIHGVFICIGYVSVMYRLSIGTYLEVVVATQMKDNSYLLALRAEI